MTQKQKIFRNDSKIVCQTIVPNCLALKDRVAWYTCVDLIDEYHQCGTYCGCRKFGNRIHIQRYRIYSEWLHIRRVPPFAELATAGMALVKNCRKAVNLKRI